MARVDRRPRRRLGAEQRRSAILDAAREAFSRAPYDQVSLAAVAEAAEASEALVHRYFATKSGLHAEVVRGAVETLLRRQRDADEALGPDATPRERLVSSIEVYLDFVADAGEGWAAPLRNPHDGSVAAARLRVETRERYVRLLRLVLGLPVNEPRDHALRGYLGFLDAACLSWVDAGRPAGQRSAIVGMALGALDGALHATEVEKSIKSV
jgi:AcrR family transcriptional regulator